MMNSEGVAVPVVADAKGRLGRLLWTALGTLFLGIGIIGIPLPILPTTPLLLLAAACYIRGSPRMYLWMMTNRYFGRYLKDYSEGRGVSRRAKAVALAFLWSFIGLSALLATENLIMRLVLLVVAAGVTVHLLTLRTKIQSPS
ncbi:MAG TPA: YbaN family protein [Thermoplasmata archaeon]|jgi:uncharacterized membrane protein YbaN (DUF454 family)